VEPCEQGFRVPVLEAGFLGDVLGFEGSVEDLLGQLGFSTEDVARAEAWAFGHGDLTGWDGVPADLAAVLSDPSAFEAALRTGLDAVSAIPDTAATPIDWRTTPAQAARLLADGAREGRRAVRLMRAAVPAGLLLDLPEPERAPQPREAKGRGGPGPPEPERGRERRRRARRQPAAAPPSRSREPKPVAS